MGLEIVVVQCTEIHVHEKVLCRLVSNKNKFCLQNVIIPNSRNDDSRNNVGPLSAEVRHQQRTPGISRR